MKTALVLFYNNQNKNSFRALFAALETSPEIDNIELYIVKKEGNLLPQLSELNKDNKKIILCFSFFTACAQKHYNLMASVKEKFPAITIIAGGPHPSGMREDTLKAGAGIVLCGEGEKSFIRLIACINSGGELRDVKGIAVLEQGRLITTPPEEPIQLDSYPPYAKNLGDYGQIEITRGCPFCCAFCQTSRLFGTVPRHRSIGNIIKHVECMIDKGLKDLRFITPNAFSYGSPDGREINIPALTELITRLRQTVGNGRNIFFGTFPSEVRPEHVTPETVALLRHTDNPSLVIGAQSGSDAVLQRANRGHAVQDILNAAQYTKDISMDIIMDFIFGLPGETEEDMEESLRLIGHLTGMGIKIHGHTFYPLPQTPYRKHPPGTVHPKVYNKIERLTGKGLAFGSWRQPGRPGGQ